MCLSNKGESVFDLTNVANIQENATLMAGVHQELPLPYRLRIVSPRLTMRDRDIHATAD
ncbi:hypothetical protein ABIC10_008927 [Bradyrhizobium sp. S3.2.12]